MKKIILIAICAVLASCASVTDDPLKSPCACNSHYSKQVG